MHAFMEGAVEKECWYICFYQVHISVCGGLSLSDLLCGFTLDKLQGSDAGAGQGVVGRMDHLVSMEGSRSINSPFPVLQHSLLRSPTELNAMYSQCALIQDRFSSLIIRALNHCVRLLGIAARPFFRHQTPMFFY